MTRVILRSTDTSVDGFAHNRSALSPAGRGTAGGGEPQRVDGQGLDDAYVRVSPKAKP